MKILILALVLIAGVIFASGFAAQAEKALTADRAADVQSHSPPAAVVDVCTMIRETEVPGIRESVGAAVLNIAMAYAPQPKTEQGFAKVELKPKIVDIRIERSLGFSGLGGNHFARADV